MLILLPWDLNKLHLEVVNSILHMLEVLLHPFVLAFIVPINLTSYYLGIAVHNHIFSSCRLGKVQPRYQSFVLCLIICCREIKIDHAFDLIPFRAVEYHASSNCLPVGRSISVDSPLRILHQCGFYNEVSHTLSFNSHA